MNVSVRDLLMLSAVRGVGTTRLRALVERFEDTGAILRAGARELALVQGMDRKTAAAVAQAFRGGAEGDAARFADEQLSRLNRTNARILTLWDAEYPSNLRTIYDPPPLLFLRGVIHADLEHSIAVVGTRTMSAYGRAMAAQFGTALAELGVPVVSGLARGVDTAAHTAVLKARGRTWGVIGSGVDVIYPPENRALAERMMEEGGLLSEFPMGTKPDPGNFPRRNRIISGITLGTLVVETAREGGAMITASTALDQNRELFAVPSAVSDRKPSGTNMLIRQGHAKLTEGVQDILDELGRRLKPVLKRPPAPPPPLELSLFEERLYEQTGDQPVHIDQLSERAGMPVADALVHLLSLEFKGAVRQLRGKVFVRA